MRFDFIVVGGGSAGCVIATRLSEDPGCTVLLVEAGPDHPDVATLPLDILDSSQPTVEHDWGYTADEVLDRGISLPRARIMGGCSSTNACFAQRGAPEDYDGWTALGNAGWGFSDALDDFRRLERDADFTDEWHGADGPIPVRRHPPEELNAVQTSFLVGATSLGHAYVADHNRPGLVGAGPSPRTAINGTRMSTAITYLAQARGRPNLTIRSDSMVSSVECTGTRVTGIRLIDGTLVQAGRVVITSGAYASPGILMRSGIGPADELRNIGIEPIVDLPGVGMNLSDHALLSVDLPTRPSPGPTNFGVHLTMRSSFAGLFAPPDLMIFTAGPFDADPEEIRGGAAFGIVVGLMAPKSRGWVRLVSSEPNDPPRIHLGHLSDSEDLERMLDGVEEARRIASSEPVAARVTGAEMSPGVRAPLGDRQSLASWAKSAVSTFHHPAGTCSMGSSPESGAVTDARGSVHGIDGLTVADASIMPTVPTGTPNLPIIMVAERIARLLRDH